MDSEIQQQLTKLAFKRSIPFCYGCYKEAPTGRCSTCGSDDLMRLVPGVGCEWGTQWVLEHILETELEPANMGQLFEDSIRDCYPEVTKVGWTEFDTVDLLKENDPVGWRCGLSDYESQAQDDGVVISPDNGSTYYLKSDVETLLAD